MTISTLKLSIVRYYFKIRYFEYLSTMWRLNLQHGQGIFQSIRYLLFLYFLYFNNKLQVPSNKKTWRKWQGISQISPWININNAHTQWHFHVKYIGIPSPLLVTLCRRFSLAGLSRRLQQTRFFLPQLTDHSIFIRFLRNRLRVSLKPHHLDHNTICTHTKMVTVTLFCYCDLLIVFADPQTICYQCKFSYHYIV